MTDADPAKTESAVAPPPAPASDAPQAVARVEPRSRARLIWLVPLIALVAVAILAIQEWRDRGPRIDIEVPRASGIEAGQTLVLSQGVPIGFVEDVRLDADLARPIVVVRLHRWASTFARDGSTYWVVRPSIGFNGVSGLETLTSGPVLEARPGPREGVWKQRFVALAQAPADLGPSAGLRLALTTPRLGSVRVGSPVVYRDMEVGTVTDTRLSDDAKSVIIDVTIATRFAPFVREGSRFWNTSGFGVDLGVTGFKLRTESLQSLLAGGIAFATPSADEAPAKTGATFELAAEPEKDWLRWAPSIELGK